MTREEAIKKLLEEYCGYGDSNCERCAFDCLIRNVVEALSQPPADQWIPVAEKLPSKEGRYLCFWGTGVMEVLRFSNDLYEVDKYDFYEHKGKAGFYAYDSEWGYSEVDYITAWAELPEPYKGAK